jgi:hypothetical protein
VDGNPETIWNSGQDPEQWIILDLGAPRSISSIRLVVAQYPEGDSVHQVWVGPTTTDLTLLHEFTGDTRDGDVLEFTAPAPLEGIQFVRVVTTRSTSWVAWREIEVQ